MPHVFQATNGLRVEDTTHVFPFLNSNDVHSGLAPGLLDDFSLAIGEIEPRSRSKIHVHPLVTWVTMVLDGRLDVRLRDESTPDPETVRLAQHQATLVRPGGFIQLINDSVFLCRTLYVVAPAYAFDVDAADCTTRTRSRWRSRGRSFQSSTGCPGDCTTLRRRLRLGMPRSRGSMLEGAADRPLPGSAGPASPVHR